MYRAPLVGNRVCAARVRKRYEGQRAERLREMKPQIDTKPPETTSMPHLKVNKKRDELLNQRHDDIERDNRIMLEHMRGFARKSDLSASRSCSLPTLKCPGGPAMQREYARIMTSNRQMLRRLKRAQGQINVREFEASYEHSTKKYVRLGCEYPNPPLLRRRPFRHTSPLTMSATRLPDIDPQLRQQAPSSNADARTSPEDLGAVAPRGPLPEEDGDLRYVMQEQRMIGDESYWVEMATDGRVLAISIYDERSDQGYELLLNADDHRRIREETGGDYSFLAQRLMVRSQELLIAAPGVPPEHGLDRVDLTPSSGPMEVAEDDASSAGVQNEVADMLMGDCLAAFMMDEATVTNDEGLVSSGLNAAAVADDLLHACVTGGARLDEAGSSHNDCAALSGANTAIVADNILTHSLAAVNLDHNATNP